MQEPKAAPYVVTDGSGTEQCTIVVEGPNKVSISPVAGWTALPQPVWQSPTKRWPATISWILQNDAQAGVAKTFTGAMTISFDMANQIVTYAFRGTFSEGGAGSDDDWLSSSNTDPVVEAVAGATGGYA